MRKWFILSGIVCGLLVLTAFMQPSADETPQYIPSSPQRTGNAAKGLDYLTTGDYVKSGLPYSFFIKGFGKSTTNYLNRTGLNATISHEYTAIKAANGEDLVAPNCLQCHAQVMDDQLIMGMGNTFIDFSDDRLNSPQIITMAENLLKATAPKKYEASKDFLRITKTIGPYLKTPVRGVNTADRLAAVLAAHRDPTTFKWSDKPLLPIPATVIPSDVPAWWLLKKKHGMFYNGFGRGDFGRFLMASNLLTVTDSAEAKQVDTRIPDVLAYIYSLQPPHFTGSINQAMATKGQALFTANCSKCHGTYGDNSTYPNLLIPQSIIQTDSMLYSANYQNPQFVNWFNNSWFAMGNHPAKLVPFSGYIAPPLDGIWATAPYLHNGSVPTLEAVLNSKMRPVYWQRDYDKPVYNKDQPGWQHTVVNGPSNSSVYNTTLPGYGNYGHRFGDKLTDAERKAVVEYLKTL